jgi:hypothetical protein
MVLRLVVAVPHYMFRPTWPFSSVYDVPLLYSYNRLIGHENSYVTELSNPLNVRRRLKRQRPSDLKDQREEEE